MAWRRALASPHSPKTARAASMICWGRSSGRLRHFGATDFAGTDLVLCIAKQIVTDQSVIYYPQVVGSITCFRDHITIKNYKYDYQPGAVGWSGLGLRAVPCDLLLARFRCFLVPE